MSVSVSKSTRRRLAPALRTAALWAGVALVAALGIAYLSFPMAFHEMALRARHAPGAKEAAEPAPASDASATDPATTVQLPEGKFERAGIATDRSRVVALPSEFGVTGRIDANTDRRVEVRPRASGVVRSVHAALGQSVKAGDLLAVLDSPDVGTARLNLRGRQRELATARIESDWKNQVAENVARIVPELRRGVPAATIEKQYADRPLGQDRALLLQAYAELEIAAHEEIKQGEFLKKKIVGEHPAFVAMHNRESAQAKFEAALEQVRYDANQEKLLAAQRLQLAEAAVIDAAQRLRILGVSEDIDALLAHAADPKELAREDVTAYRVAAPFDGTILTKAAVPSQKAEMNDVLFTVADLSNVWVFANVGESDLAYLPRLRDGTIRLAAAAYPGKTFEARLLSIGATVDPATRTVPIQAETPNPDGLFKIGMFVRIVLDTAAGESALTVPTASLVEIEGRRGVFLPDLRKARTFHFRPVHAGRESGDRTVVLSGLDPDQGVVSRGAFFLKSELILQNETEEE